jgi:DNA replication and repair protein RecF
VRLTDFRSYESVDVSLQPGVSILIGANGQGKTNLVEAIAYCSVLGSHRVTTDAPLVRSGAERAIVSVELEREGRQALVELEINPGRANRARINRGSPSRARDVLGMLACVVFAPEDLALVKGDPAERRRFIDELLIQSTPRLQGVRSDYERTLKQRNALLKSAYATRGSGMQSMLETLAVWNDQLAATGAEIVAARLALIHAMQPHLAQAYELISGGAAAVSDSVVRLDYVPSVDAPAPSNSTIEDWRAALLATMERRQKEELDRGITLVGPHRDDLLLTLGELPAKGYASHGESWSIALALRLASFEILRADGEEPVLVLDDVFAELDSARRSRLSEVLVSCDQVLITAAVPEDVPAVLNGARFEVTRGRVTPWRHDDG